MPRIALVDDDHLLTRLLTHVLEERGHEVLCYGDGAEALLAHEDNWLELDAVITDVNMPRLDGISLCKAIRDKVGKELLPVIMMSTLESEEDIMRGLEAGADDYVVKPFAPNYLLGKLEAFLIHRQRCPSTPTQELALLERGARLPHPFDRYVLESLLGEGGFSWVYAARRQSDGLPVAIKILKPEQLEDRSALSRYFREVSLLGERACPHVVRVLGSGYAEGHFFIVMERVPGVTTYQQVREHGPLPVQDVIRVGQALCTALSGLSSRGLVHRDIKPSNVILGPEGAVTLIDLGLAKAAGDQSLTLPSELLGTAEYLAPEVIRGAPENTGSDLYAVGVTLYELLTRTKPFGKEGALAILSRVKSGAAAPSAHEVRPEVPLELSRLLERLMCPRVEERLVDPQEARAEFARLLAQEWISLR